MTTINKRVEELEQQVKDLTNKLNDISQNVEEKYKKPISIVGGTRDKSLIRVMDAKAGMGQMYGGQMIWNDTEISIPRVDQEPTNPSTVSNRVVQSYNKHSHSRYNGGALIKDVLEIVEYEWGSIVNKHSQQYWQKDPKIKTEVDTSNPLKPTVEKIGLLDLIFNPSTKTWGVAAYEIDVKKCYLVQRDENGDVELDENGNEMKSPLWNEDTTKTSIVWDKNAQVFRFYAAYAPGA